MKGAKRVVFLLVAFVLGPSVLRAQQQVISHVTGSGGGFETIVFLHNFAADVVDYTLRPYQANGQALPEVRGFLAAGESKTMAIAEVFPGLSNVSHFVTDSDPAGMHVAVSYRVASGRGSPAHVEASEMASELWRIFPGNWNLVFDGIAFVNRGNSSANVRIVQKGFDGTTLMDYVVNSSLDPMAKDLFVIGGPSGSEFETSATSYFEVEASQPLAMTSLQGTPPGQEVGYLWVNQAELPSPSETRMVPHVTRATGGFQTTVLIQNRTNSARSVNLVPHDASGALLQAVSRRIDGYGTVEFSVESLFGEQSDSVSHFEIEDTSSFVQVSVRYQAATGNGTPALVSESGTPAQVWPLYSGDWSEVFDGVALVNTGDLNTDVSVQQIGSDGTPRVCKRVVQDLAPNEKALYVLGGPVSREFDPALGRMFLILSSEPIVITALRGTPPTASIGYLWRNPSQPNLTYLENYPSVELWPMCIPTENTHIVGYISQQGEAWVITDQAGASMGQAVANQTVELVDPFLQSINGQDGVIMQTTTDADGKFEFTDTPTGLHVIAASNGNFTLSHPVSLYPYARLFTWSPGFDRTRAAEMAIARAGDEALVLGTMQPLTPGTLVWPRGAPTPYSELYHACTNPEWFFMIVDTPGALYGKPVTYLFIDSTSGAVAAELDVFQPPRINYAKYWFSDRTYYMTGIDWWDPFARASLNPDDLEPIASSEVIRTSELTRAKLAEVIRFSTKTDKEDVFAMVVNGSPDCMTLVAYNKMVNALLAQGIPIERIGLVDTSSHVIGDGYYKVEMDDINAKMAKRRQEGGKPVLILYYIGHHNQETLWGEYCGKVALEYADGDTNWGGASFGMRMTQACKIRAILDTCSSRTIAQGMANDLDLKSDDQRPDYQIYGATEDDQKSRGTYFTGTFFTNALLANFDVTDENLGLQNEDGSLIDDLYDLWGWQEGILIQRPNDANCPDNPMVMIDPDDGGTYVSLCTDQQIGGVEVTNGSGQEVSVSASTDHEYVFLENQAFHLAPGQSQTVSGVLPGDPENQHGQGDINANVAVTASFPGADPVTQEANIHAEHGPDRDAFEIMQLINPNMSDAEIDEFLSNNTRFAEILVEVVNSFGLLGIPECGTEIAQYGGLILHLTQTLLNAAFQKRATFPCGEGPNGYTVCAAIQADPTEGDYFMFFQMVRQSIPVNDQVNHYQFGFVFDSDNNPNNNFIPGSQYPYDLYRDTDLWYSVEYTPSLGWVLDVTDARGGSTTSIASAAHAIIRDNIIVIFIPRNEFTASNPQFRVTSYRHTGDYGQSSPHDWSGDLHPPVDQPLDQIQSP